MGSETLKDEKRHVHEENGNGVLAKQSKAVFRLGDVMWVKLRGTSWWPAQLVDEKAVCDSIKPPKGNRDDVLVRLYGTYDYSYVDVLKSNLEFNNVLKRHKGSHKDIIKKSLKQDFSESQSGESETHSSKDVSTGKQKNEKGGLIKEKATPTKRATDKQDGEKKKRRPNSQSPQDRTPEECGASARRFKVMQGLGLVAPSGSPFRINGRTLSIMH